MAMLSMEKRLRGGGGANLEGPLQGTRGLVNHCLFTHLSLSVSYSKGLTLFVSFISTSLAQILALVERCLHSGKETKHSGMLLDEMDKWMDE